MRRVVTASAVILVSSFAAFATDYGRFETFVGYTYTRFQTSNQFVGAPFDLNVPNFNAHGGSAQFAYNFNRWFSAVVDAGAVTSTGDIGDFGNSILLPALSRGGGFNGTLANYLLGPRASFKKGSRFVPYVQALFGGATLWESLPVPDVAIIVPPIAGGGVIIPNGANIRFNRATSGFAMTAGGGLDIKINRHVLFRPIQAEYFLTRLSPIGAFGVTTRNNFRYSVGINFSYGEPR
jgi:hypothetical protein